MQVTRTKTFHTTHGEETVSITVYDSDLSEEERVPLLREARATLMDLRAEQYIVTVMFRRGAFHRKAEKNQKLAGLKLAEIETVRAGILKAAT